MRKETCLLVCTCVALSSVFAVAQSTRAPVRNQPNGMRISRELHAPVHANFSQMPQVGSSARRSGRAAKQDASSPIGVHAPGLSFAATVSYSSGPASSGYEFANSITVGDLNGDGTPDLVVVNGCSGSCSCTNNVSVLLGSSIGSWKASGLESPPITQTNSDWASDSPSLRMARFRFSAT